MKLTSIALLMILSSSSAFAGEVAPEKRDAYNKAITAALTGRKVVCIMQDNKNSEVPGITWGDFLSKFTSMSVSSEGSQPLITYKQVNDGRNSSGAGKIRSHEILVYTSADKKRVTSLSTQVVENTISVTNTNVADLQNPEFKDILSSKVVTSAANCTVVD